MRPVSVEVRRLRSECQRRSEEYVIFDGYTKQASLEKRRSRILLAIVIPVLVVCGFLLLVFGIT